MPNVAATVRTVTSKDGTTIASSVAGVGTAIVLVHGTTGSDFSWALVRPHLEASHTVFALQRRGRGDSGDATDYSLEREAEDVAAVVDSIEGPVVLVGHSYGATCCLQASLLTTNIGRLVLYEPAFDWSLDDDEPTLQKVEALVAAGDSELATETYLREAAQLSDEEISAVRSSPTWSQRAAAAHTFTREDRAAAAHRLNTKRLAGMTVPTLLLTGSESPPMFRPWIDQTAAVLPDSTVHILEGHGHAANVTAPDMLASEILTFAHSSPASG